MKKSTKRGELSESYREMVGKSGFELSIQNKKEQFK